MKSLLKWSPLVCGLSLFGATSSLGQYEDNQYNDTVVVEDEPVYTADRDRERVSVEDRSWFGPEQGDVEITLAGSGSNDKDFENGSFNISADVSTYLTEALSLGVRQTVGFADTLNGSSWTGDTSIFAQLHLLEGPFRPFIGAGVGYLYGDDVNDSLFGGPEAGFRYYVKPEAFLFGRAAYQFLFDSGDDLTDQFDDGRFVYTVGVGFTF